jgi:simple sugar transport system permease protein
MDIYFIIQQTMFFVIPLLVVALGGMFSEKSGIINIGLEGVMIVGAFAGVIFINIMQTAGAFASSPQLLLLIALLFAGIIGMIYSTALAAATIHLKADQTIIGTALNMFAPAAVIFIARATSSEQVKQVFFTPSVFKIEKVPLLGDIPIIGKMFFQNTYITFFVGIIILVGSIVILYKTRFGLRLSACGEHPQAASSVGVNVYKMRWAGVLISGALAGLGGLIYIVPTSTSFSGDVAGYGFLALAVMIFGQWKPFRIFLAALFFGFFKALSAVYGGIDFITDLKIPTDIATYIFNLIPYLATVIALAFSSRKSRAPKAEGIPYDPGAR